MATGILGKASLADSVNTTLYTVPAGKVTVCTINVCNTGTKTPLLRLALSATTTPAANEWIEWDRSISSSATWSPIERSGIVIGAGTSIVAYSAGVGVNIMVWGYEEAA